MPANEIGGSKRSNELKIDMKDDMYSSSQEDLKKLQNDTILKRIPAGAEATTVLVSREKREWPSLDYITRLFFRSVPWSSWSSQRLPLFVCRRVS